MVHHIIIQTTLFLAAGLIERRGGTTTLDRLGGLARLAPLLGVLFFLPALNLAGIPPFSGFLGKLGLLAGRRRRRRRRWPGSWWPAALVTSLLTLYAVGPRLEPGLLAYAPRCDTGGRRRRRRPGAAPADGRARPSRWSCSGIGLTVRRRAAVRHHQPPPRTCSTAQPYVRAVFAEEVAMTGPDRDSPPR